MNMMTEINENCARNSRHATSLGAYYEYMTVQSGNPSDECVALNQSLPLEQKRMGALGFGGVIYH